MSHTEEFKETYAFLEGLTEYVKHSSQEVITAKMSREFLSELVGQLNELLSRKEANAETNNSSTE